jgi:hypothetical protein
VGGKPAGGSAVPALMLSERDIWRAAKSMIQRYGTNAGIEVAARADDQSAKGHTEIASTWRRILVAIEKLQAEKPEPGETVQ